MAGRLNLHPEGMRDELSCCVCLDLFCDPVTLPCEHSMCEKCVKQIRSGAGRSIECPLCRRPFQFGDQKLKKNHVLIRIVEVYKEDALRRTKSCMDLSTIAPKHPSSTIKLLQKTPEFCKQLDDSPADNAPVTLNSRVLDVRARFTNCERTQDDEVECLTRCTATCTDPPNRAVILCVTCCNQFCRVCWGREHDLQHNEDHDINVYVKAFQEPDGKDAMCSVCDPESSQKAKYICFHCNVNFCQTCFKLTHPEITIHHCIVKRPDVIPEQRYCSFCTPTKIATSICSLCKECFCKRCLPKIHQHKCFNELNNSNQLNGTVSLDRNSDSEKKIKKELFNIMQLKKQIIQEIPKFALKKATRGKTDLCVGDRVVYIEDERNYKCTVRWIGKLKDKISAIIGVEFNFPVGTGDGAYDGERKFSTIDNYAGFIDPIYLIKESDYNPRASIADICGENGVRDGGHEYGQGHFEVGNDLETDGVDYDANPENIFFHQGRMDDDLQIFSERFSTDNLNPSSLDENDLATVQPIIASNLRNNPVAQSSNQQPIPKPQKSTQAKNDKNYSLKIGDYVAYFHEESDTLIKGVVKWIGVLPDAGKMDDKITVGVEFEEAIGSGTGKYKDHRLFYAKIHHASLIPIEGLLMYNDVCT